MAGDFNTKEILEMIANFLIPVVTFSITDAVIRFGLDRAYDKRAVFSNAVTVVGFGSIVFLLLSPCLLFYADIRSFVPLLAGYIVVSSFRQLSTQFARVRGFVNLYAADGILCTLTLFLFNLLFIGALHLGVTGFLLSVLLSDLLSGLTVWVIAGHSRFYSPRFVDKELLRVMTRFSLPLIPTAILWIITGFSDRLFIRYMLSQTEAGIYGAAAKIPNLISMVSNIFYLAWNMSAIEENDSEDRSAFYTLVYDAYQGLLVLASGFIIALDKPLSFMLISTRKDAAYASAYLYTPPLVLAVLLMCYNQFLSSVYTVSKHTKNSLVTSLVATVLNLILNALLIPRLGISGAVAATFLSYFVCYLIRVVDTRRYIPFTVDHGKFFANMVVLLAMCRLIQTQPSYMVFGLVLGLLGLLCLNMTPLLMTARKILRR